jgi:hypothetical protein
MHGGAYIRKGGGGLIFGMARVFVNVVGLYTGGLYSEVYCMHSAMIIDPPLTCSTNIGRRRSDVN